MRLFGYDIVMNKVQTKRLPNSARLALLDYYRTPREEMVFSKSEILDCQRLISDRLANVEFSSRFGFVTDKQIFDFVKDNRLQIIRRLFFDGYAIINAEKMCFAKDDVRNSARTMDGQLSIELNDGEIIVFSECFQSTGHSDAWFLRDKLRFLDAINSSDYNLIENYGAMGIVSPQNDGSVTGAEFDAEEISALQENYKKHYGITLGKWQLMFVPRPTSYTKIDLPIAQLQLAEKRKYAISAVFSALGVPKELGVYFDNSTYENRKQAELDFYNGTIKKWAEVLLSVAEEMYAYLMSSHMDYLKRDNEYWYDFRGVSVLQESQRIEKENARTELQFWKDVVLTMPEHSATAEKRIKDLIENL